jgi:hypothetical protein
MSGAMRTVWRRVGFAVWCIVAASLLCEIVLQLAPRLFPVEVQKLLAARTRSRLQLANIKREYECEDIRFCKPKPHAMIHRIRQDEVGFPNRPGRYSSTEKFSIVTLGDSFTHGNKHRYSYPRALEKYSRLSVLNLGLVGAPPQIAYEALKRYGLRKHPDIVILGIFHGNDFQDMILYEKRLQLGESYMTPERVDPPPFALDSTLFSWMLYHSNLLSVFYKTGSLLVDDIYRDSTRRLQRRVEWLVRADSGGSESDPAVKFAEVVINGRHCGEMKHPIPIGLPFDDDSYLFVDLARIIEEINQLTVSARAELLVLLFPTGPALYYPFVSERGRADKAFALVDWEYRQISQNVRRICTSLGAHFLDLRGELQRELESAEEPPQIYDGEFGGHFNPKGNDLIGRLVAHHLVGFGLVEAR